MVVKSFGFDSYNQQSVEEVSPTLKTDGGGRQQNEGADH